MFQSNSNAASFLPEDYVQGKTQSRANTLALLLFGIVLTGIVGAFVLNNSRLEAILQEEREIQAQNKSAAEDLKSLRALRVQREELVGTAEIVTALIERVPRSVLLGELIRGIPEELILTSMELDGERVRRAPPATAKAADSNKARSLTSRVGAAKNQQDTVDTKILPPTFKHTITVEGLARENSDVADYLATLKSSDLLRGVELRFINETSQDGVELRKFEITMKVNPQSDLSQIAGVREMDLLEEGAPTARAEPEDPDDSEEPEAFGLVPALFGKD